MMREHADDEKREAAIMSVNKDASAGSAKPTGRQAVEPIDLFPPWAADTGMTALDVANGFANKPELKERYEEWEANDPGIQRVKQSFVRMRRSGLTMGTDRGHRLFVGDNRLQGAHNALGNLMQSLEEHEKRIDNFRETCREEALHKAKVDISILDIPMLLQQILDEQNSDRLVQTRRHWTVVTLMAVTLIVASVALLITI